MFEHLFIFAAALFLVAKGAILATKYSAKLAEHFSVSRYVIGFVVVAFISILPETVISIQSAINDVPELGLGTLFGSNIADLTLIFAVLILVARRGIRIDGSIMRNVRLYPFFLLMPILFGLNGHYSRIEGVVLILSGVLFYYLIFRDGSESSKVFSNSGSKTKDIAFLFFAMSLILVGAHFTVTSATALAEAFHVMPILIGLLVISLGTTIPELSYSLQAMKRRDDSLAVGDILGSVLADATIVVGILAVLNPFAFPSKIIWITGAFMLFASLVLLYFMRSGRIVSKREGWALLILWSIYVALELVVNT